MNEKLVLTDYESDLDNFKGKVSPETIGKLYIKNEFGEFKYMGTNKVLYGGLLYTTFLRDKVYYGAVETFEDTLYSIAMVNQKDLIIPDNPANDYDYTIMGYNVGIDGGSGNGVLPYDRSKLGYLKDLSTTVPWRCIPVSSNDYDLYKDKYLHSAILRINENDYVCYYTKKFKSVTGQFLYTNGAAVPDYPNDTIPPTNSNGTTLDLRAVVNRELEVDPTELIEWFQLTQGATGNTAVQFNATSLVMGKPATITLASGIAGSGANKVYRTMSKSIFYARSNHVSVGKGGNVTVIGSLPITYQQVSV